MDMDTKIGGSVLFGGGELCPHLAPCGLDQGRPPCHVPRWSIHQFGHNRRGPKIGEGALPPFGEGGTGSPSHTMSPGPRPASVPSGILIHAAVLAAIHQRHRQDRQTDRQDNGPMAQGEPFYERSPKKTETTSPHEILWAIQWRKPHRSDSLYDNFCKTENHVIYDVIIWVQDGNCKKWLERILVLVRSTI